jgi:predicted RNase H-like nuclease (RuvC/YqgF family)
MADNGNLERLITDMKDSLERELHQFRSEVGDFRQEMRNRFDNQAIRMDHQFGLLETGRRRIAHTDKSVEKIYQALEVKDREIAELRARIEKLEGGR